MAKKPTAITKVQPATELARPDFMNEAPMGVDDLKQFITPPRLKIVQKQAGDELLKLFGIGDTIITPNNLLVSEMERDNRGQPAGEAEPFLFVPIYFFVEFCTWNPMELKGIAPAIRARSVDPNSDIARKARDASLRMEQLPDNPKLKMRHVEHLNFISMLIGPRLIHDEPVVTSFSKGEHGKGRNLCSLIKMRKAPIYGCVFEAHTAYRENQMGNWWGWDVINPSGDQNPWVEQANFEAFKALHLEFAKLHQSGKVRVDYEDEQVVEPAAGGEDKF
jgi:hypothetical protein